MKINSRKKENAKVKLVQLYFDGKTREIDNVQARSLLEEAYYQQKNVNARELLAYMYANGIGGKSDKEKALDLFMQEYKDNNPNPMVYVELTKLLSKDKTYKDLRKNLSASVTNLEKNKYKRKRFVDKVNNHTLGKIVTFLPTLISPILEKSFEQMNEEIESYDTYKLYEKACDCEKYEEYDKAREIFKRLAYSGDRDSQLKYAKMAYKGIGGEKDVESARDIYEEILDEKDRKLLKLRCKIRDKKILKNEKVNQLRSKKELKEIDSEIEYLESKIKKITSSPDYKSAMLNFGLLLVDNPRNKDDLADGILYLQSLAKKGEVIPKNGKELSKIAKKHNKQARIAIKKLGKLYEKGIWQIDEENKPEARKLFLKFSSGKIAKYTLNVAEKLKTNSPLAPKKIKKENRKISKIRECKIRYPFGCICDALNLKKFARSIYSSAVKKGDYRASYPLAILEKNGKGGKVDDASALKHFSEYSEYVSKITQKNSEDKTVFIRKYHSEYLVGKILENQGDTIGAIEKYKLAAKGGEKSATVRLVQLYKQDLWKPEEGNLFEKKLISDRKIQKAVGKIEAKENKISTKNKFFNGFLDETFPISATMSVALALGITTQEVFNRLHLSQNNINYTDNDTIVRNSQENTVKPNTLSKNSSVAKQDKIVEFETESNNTIDFENIETR